MQLFMRVRHEALIHASSLMNFYMFPCSADYIFILSLDAHHFGSLDPTPTSEIVVELSLSSLAADRPLIRHLGFNLMSSGLFFLLSQPSHLHLHDVMLWLNQL